MACLREAPGLRGSSHAAAIYQGWLVPNGSCQCSHNRIWFTAPVTTVGTGAESDSRVLSQDGIGAESDLRLLSQPVPVETRVKLWLDP